MTTATTSKLATRMSVVACTVIAMICTVDACSYILAGKDATINHGIMASYQNDYTGNTPFAVLGVTSKPAARATTPRNKCWNAAVPPVPEGGTYTAVAVATPAITQSFLNSQGVGMNYGVYNYVRSEAGSEDPYVVSGVSTELWDLALERCSSARQVVDMVAALVAECGASSYLAGGSIGVFDRTEAWSIEVVSGHHFVAARVPDNAYVAQPNMVRVSHVDPTDASNYVVSPGFFDFARTVGGVAEDMADPALDIAAIFNRDEIGTKSARDRLWAMTRLLSPSAGMQHADTTAPGSYATFAVPDAFIDDAALRRVHRDHGENTEYIDLVGGNECQLASPHTMESMEPTFTPVCRSIATYHVIWNIPADPAVPATISVGAGCACTGAQVPYWVETVDAFATDATAVANNANKYELPSIAVDEFRQVQHKIDSSHMLASGLSVYATHIGAIRDRQTLHDVALDTAISEVSEASVQQLVTITQEFSTRAQTLADTARDELL